MTRQVLLVEGRDDQTFYEAVCRDAERPRILVKTPSSLASKVEGKTNAIHHLPLLMKQLEDGSVTHLGLVVDADYEQEHGLGFRGTLTKVREKVATFGFQSEIRLPTNGFTFSHPDGLPTIGIWIMPDNKNDGMLEDFIKQSIREPIQSRLHEMACQAVAKLNPPLFKHFHRSKAEVATWLAWQRLPGAPKENVIGNSLIDTTSRIYSSLRAWIEAVFS